MRNESSPGESVAAGSAVGSAPSSAVAAETARRYSPYASRATAAAWPASGPSVSSSQLTSPTR